MYVKSAMALLSLQITFVAIELVGWSSILDVGRCFHSYPGVVPKEINLRLLIILVSTGTLGWVVFCIVTLLGDHHLIFREMEGLLRPLLFAVEGACLPVMQVPNAFIVYRVSDWRDPDQVDPLFRASTTSSFRLIDLGVGETPIGPCLWITAKSITIFLIELCSYRLSDCPCLFNYLYFTAPL